MATHLECPAGMPSGLARSQGMAAITDFPSAHRLEPQSRGLIFLLGALTGLTALSIDMSLPALPTLASSLHTSTDQAALTLSMFLAGYSVSQLFYGPLSDRYGRRPLLLAGLILFTIGGIGCALAPNIGQLVGWRLAQGRRLRRPDPRSRVSARFLPTRAWGADPLLHDAGHVGGAVIGPDPRRLPAGPALASDFRHARGHRAGYPRNHLAGAA